MRIHWAAPLGLLVGLACGETAAEDSCGDGIRAELEACDDGNLEAGDGCAPTCRVERGWICPDGSCETACGDGVVAGEEACDDGNLSSNDGCSGTCTVETVVGRLSAVVGADPGAEITSNTVTVNASEGTLLQLSALGRFDEILVVDGTPRGPSARVAGRSEVALRMTAPPDFVANRTTALLVGEFRLNWVISTRTSTFAWITGPWSECSTPCGDGFQRRDVRCQDEGGMKVDEALCDANIPDNVRTCTETSGCSYAYGPWSAWSTCTNDVRTRSRDCLRQDGVTSDCRQCGGECAGMSACDVDCPGLSGAVIDCSPRAPGDKMACDAVLDRARARCTDAGCAIASGSSAECTVGGNPGARQCYGGVLRCE